MKLIFLILLLLAIAYVIGTIIIERIKTKAYQKGYEQAEFDLTASMIDKAYWFSGCSKITYNVLYIFAATYRKYGHVSANTFRDNILKLDHNQRVTDLNKDDLNSFI